MEANINFCIRLLTKINIKIIANIYYLLFNLHSGPIVKRGVGISDNLYSLFWND